MSCIDEFLNDGGTDEAGGAGDEDTHVTLLCGRSRGSSRSWVLFRDATTAFSSLRECWRVIYCGGHGRAVTEWARGAGSGGERQELRTRRRRGRADPVWRQPGDRAARRASRRAPGRSHVTLRR